MNTTFPTNKPHLESILRREDVWRGDSKRFMQQEALDSGYEGLNNALMSKGWPLGTLVEVCQPFSYGHSEWHLFSPALTAIDSGYIVLLNPPALPFSQGLLQAGFDLDRLVVVQSNDKSSFLKSFVELARARTCQALLAWQPQQALSYTDLRKCLLAASAHSLTVLFRHTQASQQSSPAALRLFSTLKDESVSICIFKQKGVLAKKNQTIELPLPSFLSRSAHQPEIEKEQQGTAVVSLFEKP